MEYPFLIQIHKYSLIIIILSILIEGKVPGGLKFGYQGKTYSFSTKTCQGGIFFKKPIALDYICPNGYFLKRSSGCSSTGEDIVGAEKYVCTEYKKHEAKVQALIPVTNADYPTAHTIALYEDEDMLTGFRRYTIESAVRKLYIPKENGSSFMLVANPRNTADMSIGKLCYHGTPHAEGSAYKVAVQSNFSEGESYGFFTKGCKNSSVNVEVSSGKRFGFSDGIPDSKRFVRAIEAQFESDEILEESPRQNRPVRDGGGDQVFLDLRKDTKDPGGEDSDAKGSGPSDPGGKDPKDPGGSDDDSSDPGGKDPKDPGGSDDDSSDPGGKDPKDPGGPDDDPSDPGGKDPKDPGGSDDDPSDPGGKDPKDPGGDDKDTGGDDKDPGGDDKDPGGDDKDPGGDDKDPGGKDPKDPGGFDPSAPRSKGPKDTGDLGGDSSGGAGSGKNDDKDSDQDTKDSDDDSKVPSGPGYLADDPTTTEDPDASSTTTEEEMSTTTEEPEPIDDGVPLTGTDLKDGILIDPEWEVVDDYFMELLEIAKMRVSELFGKVDDNGEPIEDNSTFLEKDVPALETKWYKMLNASVRAFQRLIPKTVPGEMYSEVLQLFAYLFKDIEDEPLFFPDPDGMTFKNVMAGLEKCANEPAMKPPIYGFNDTACPAELTNISTVGVKWNDQVDKYDEDVPYKVGDFDNLDPSLLGSYGFNGTSNIYVEMMFVVMDMVYVNCFGDYKALNSLNEQQRLPYYLSYLVFNNKNVFLHWRYMHSMNINLYLTMIPSWNGRNFLELMREIDIVRIAVRKRSVPYAWVSVDKDARINPPKDDDDIMVKYQDGNKISSASVEASSRPRKVKSEFRPIPKVNFLSLLKRRGSNSKIRTRPRFTGKVQNKRKRRNVQVQPKTAESGLKVREIWDGLAYCMSMVQVENSDGQTKQLGLQPSLETFKSESLC